MRANVLECPALYYLEMSTDDGRSLLAGTVCIQFLDMLNVINVINVL